MKKISTFAARLRKSAEMIFENIERDNEVKDRKISLEAKNRVFSMLRRDCNFNRIGNESCI